MMCLPTNGQQMRGTRKLKDVHHKMVANRPAFKMFHQLLSSHCQGIICNFPIDSS
jgi:hypothetical protein